MLFLSDAIRFELEHRLSSWLRGRPSEPLLAVAGEGGLSLCRLAPDWGISHIAVDGKITVACPHPSKPLLALIQGTPGKLSLIGFDGSPVFEQAAPRPPEGSPSWLTGYTDCHFDASGTYLLCAANVSGDVEIQLIETDSWRSVSRTTVEDPFGASLTSFHPTRRQDTWALWLGAGQDGQCVYWLTQDEGKLRATIEPRLENTTPPVFSPSGDEFLAVSEDGASLKRYRYPRIEEAGTCGNPYGADDSFGTSVCYLDSTRALVSSFNSRMAIIDTVAMRVVSELIIEGHEPRPAGECYPKLTGDQPLCTDISFIERVGDYLIAVYPLYHPLEPGSNGKLKFEEWRDGLLCFPVSYVLERLPAV
jgi:hypothetical protein